MSEKVATFRTPAHTAKKVASAPRVTLCPFWSEIGYGFLGNYGIVWTYLSFQFQMSKKEREICEFEKICEYLRSKLSNDNIISALRPGLKTGMEFRGLVWKRVCKITFFGLKSGQDLENREAHPHQEFQECPPGSELRKATTSTSVTFIGEYPPPPGLVSWHAWLWRKDTPCPVDCVLVSMILRCFKKERHYTNGRIIPIILYPENK